MSQPAMPTEQPRLTRVLEQNIAALTERRAREAAAQTPTERIAASITRFTGSMNFVYLHVALFGAWIAANLGLIPGVPRFDATFTILAMEASVEAIFLSTFILISQNRMNAAADKRADLDLQISLLTEHELTKLATLVAEIAEKVGAARHDDPEIREVLQDVSPEAVLDGIESAEG